MAEGGGETGKPAILIVGGLGEYDTYLHTYLLSAPFRMPC